MPTEGKAVKRYPAPLFIMKPIHKTAVTSIIRLYAPVYKIYSVFYGAPRLFPCQKFLLHALVTRYRQLLSHNFCHAMSGLCSGYVTIESFSWFWEKHGPAEEYTLEEFTTSAAADLLAEKDSDLAEAVRNYYMTQFVNLSFFDCIVVVKGDRSFVFNKRIPHSQDSKCFVIDLDQDKK